MADTLPKEQQIPTDITASQRSRDQLDEKFPEVIANSVTHAQGGPPYLPQDARAASDTTFADMIGTVDHKPESTENLKEIMPKTFASPDSTLINHLVEGATRTTSVADFNKFKQQKAARQQKELEGLKKG